MSENPLPSGEFNRKDSPREWEASYSPDFHHDIEVEKPEKNAVKTEKRQEDDSDLIMEYISEQEKRSKIRNITIKEYQKVGDHVV